MKTPNEQLHALVRKYPDLGMTQLMELTGRSRTQVYGWLCPPRSKHYKKMREHDLRLLKLELREVRPSGLVKA